jgi:hypothetical protein
VDSTGGRSALYFIHWQQRYTAAPFSRALANVLYSSGRTKSVKTRFWLFFLPLCVAMLACDSGTGSGPRPRLTTDQAAPFSLAELNGLPAHYATGTGVTVGGVQSVLVRDETDDVHRFLVPDLPPGAVEVVIPAQGSSREARLTLTVLPRRYAGGTPETALAEMGHVLDSLQVSVSRGMTVVNPADTHITGRMDAFLAVAQVLQQHVDTLSGPDRAAVAGMYSAVADEMRLLAGVLSGGFGELRAQPPVLGRPGAPLVQIPSATAVVTACENFSHNVEAYESIVQAIDYVLAAIEVLSWFGGPAGRAGAAAFSMLVGLGLDIGTLITNAVPNLIDPEGLRLQASPPRIVHMGDQGTLRAWVRRRSAGELSDMGPGLSDLAEKIEEYARMRGRVEVATIAALLGALGEMEQMQSALDWMDRQFSDFLNDDIIEPGEVPVTFDGITFSSGSPSSFWEFVDGPTTPLRRFRSLGSNSQPVQQYHLSARIGTSNGCKAATQGNDPARGINGFEISTGAEVRFTGAATVEMYAGDGASTTLGLQNRGVDTSGALTYRMQHSTGAGYVPPAWIALTITAAPQRLGPQERGTVRLSMGTAAAAPERTITIPIAVVDDGEVVDNTTLTVTVLPTPADIVVNRSPSTLRVWDYDDQEGDIITVTLNGSPVVSGTTLRNAGAVYPVRYRRGLNRLEIRAHNEGERPPNTTGISFADVVRGAASRTYGMSTGQVVRLIILYDPQATAGAFAPAPGVAPAPVLLRCGETPESCPP